MLAAVAAPSAAPPSTSDIVHATNVTTCVLVLLVLAWSLGGHQLAQRCTYLTEGSAACALGLATGLVLLLGHRLFLQWSVVTDLLTFNAAGFFTFLLPPIIFHASLCVERSRFFTSLPSILAFGVLGTLATALLIALLLYVILGFALFKLEDCLAMGAIFAATDSVATLQVLDKDAMPHLFALVFGEGVVNDAVSVVLLGAVATAAKAHTSGGGGGGGAQHRLAGGVVLNFVWLLVTSLLLGGAAGLGVATALKHLQLKEAHQEVSAIVLISYLAYLLADAAGLSAILALFVCGVAVSHYALQSVSAEGRLATLSAVRAAAHLAEGMVFVYVGLDSLDPLKWQAANALEAVWLVLVLTVLLVAARAVCVVPLSLLHNTWSAPADRLGRRDVITIWWAGLMRGAVSVALAYQYFDDDVRQLPDKGRATLIVTTLMVVMLSILGFGALTKPLLAALFGEGGGDNAAALAAQLSRIPLLGGLAHTASNSQLFVGAGGYSAPSSNSGTPGHSRQPSSSSVHHQAAAAAAAGGARGGRGGAGGGAPVWGRVLPPAAAGGNASAAGAQQQQQQQQQRAASAQQQVHPHSQFEGLDVDADAQLLAPAELWRSSEDGSDVRWQPPPPQQQQQPAPGTAVELQQPPGASTTTMQQVSHMWGQFDRRVMQPMFGGPSQQYSADGGGG